MAAFFKTPGSTRHWLSRAEKRPRLVRAWRIGADGKLEARWSAQTAEIVPLRSPAPDEAIAAEPPVRWMASA